MKPGRGATPQQKELGAEIEKLLLVESGKRDWRQAYRIEQQLAHLLDGDRLRTELARRMDEARQLNLPSADFYDARVKSELLDDQAALDDAKVDRLRALLGRLTNDLQWFYTQRYVKRGYARFAVRRVTTAFVIAFVVFVMILLFLTDPQKITAKEDAKKTNATGQTTESPEAKK